MVWLHKILIDLRKVKEKQNKVLKELMSVFQSISKYFRSDAVYLNLCSRNL